MTALQKPYSMPRAAAWRCAETLDLLVMWGEVSVQEAPVASHQNKDLFVDVPKHTSKRGHDRDADQCWIKNKQLRSKYIEMRDKRRQSGRGYVTCPFYGELDRMLHYYTA